MSVPGRFRRRGDPDTFNISTEGNRVRNKTTKAIIAVDLFGQMVRRSDHGRGANIPSSKTRLSRLARRDIDGKW
jgi:hypothetical protein